MTTYERVVLVAAVIMWAIILADGLTHTYLWIVE